MDILNASTEVVRAQHDGGIYIFAPGQIRTVTNQYTAGHLVNRWKAYGLVDVTFTARAEQQYAHPKLYEVAKTREALENVMMRLEKTLIETEMYVEAHGERNSMHKAHAKNKLKPRVEKLIADTKAKMASLENVNEGELVREYAERQYSEALEAAQAAKQKLEKLGKPVIMDGNNTTKSDRRVPN